MLEINLKIVGVLMFIMVLVNFETIRRFAWRRELQQVSLLTRQVFFVHMGFIILLLAMFGVLSLCYPQALITPSETARLLAGGLAFFWTARLVVQWVVYDRKLWLGQRFNTCVHLVFTGVWAYFAGTYSAAFWHQLQSQS